MQLIETLGKQYEVYDEEGSFSEKRFIRYLNERGIGWPVHESGRLDTKEKTFKMMAQLRPELEPLRQLRVLPEKIKAAEAQRRSRRIQPCLARPVCQSNLAQSTFQ